MLHLSAAGLSDAEFQLLLESRKKSGWIAGLLNLVIPGAGYCYCGRWILGVIALLFVVLLYVASGPLIGVSLALVLLIDGFLSANRYNKKLTERLLDERRNARQPAS